MNQSATFVSTIYLFFLFFFQIQRDICMYISNFESPISCLFFTLARRSEEWNVLGQNNALDLREKEKLQKLFSVLSDRSPWMEKKREKHLEREERRNERSKKGRTVRDRVILYFEGGKMDFGVIRQNNNMLPFSKNNITSSVSFYAQHTLGTVFKIYRLKLFLNIYIVKNYFIKDKQLNYSQLR